MTSRGKHDTRLSVAPESVQLGMETTVAASGGEGTPTPIYQDAPQGAAAV